MREPPMSHEAYQRIVDLRIEPFNLTEDEFIASKLYFDWRDIYARYTYRDAYGWDHVHTPQYFPRWLRRQWTDDEFWDLHVEFQTPVLRAAYARALADKDDYLLWKNDHKAWIAKQKTKAKPAQASLWEAA